MTSARHLPFLLLVSLLGFAGSSLAAPIPATVKLTPALGSVDQGASFSLDIVLDATHAPGDHPGLYVGEIVVDFDPAEIAYQSFAFSPPVIEKNAPVLGSAGARQTLTFGFQNAVGDVNTIGSITFLAAGSAGTSATIGIADADDFFGSFVYKLPHDHYFYPEFTGAGVTIDAVPLPATAWLFATGLGILGARFQKARRRG